MISEILLSIVIVLLLIERFIYAKGVSKRESKYINAILSKDANEFARLENNVDNKVSTKEEEVLEEFASISGADEETFNKMIERQLKGDSEESIE